MQRALDSGAAAERFERMVAALGGPKDFLARAHALLPRAPVLVEAMPEARGFVVGIDVRAVGLAVVELGGGRARAVRCDRSRGRPDRARADRRRGRAGRAARPRSCAQRRRGRSRRAAPSRRLSPRRRAARARRPGRRAHRRPPMSILFAVSGWDAAPWRTRLEQLLPSHPMATLGEPFDRAAIRYALSWRHPPGALADLPNLQVDLLARRRRRSSVRRSGPARRSRSCAWSIRTSPTG